MPAYLFLRLQYGFLKKTMSRIAAYSFADGIQTSDYIHTIRIIDSPRCIHELIYLPLIIQPTFAQGYGMLGAPSSWHSLEPGICVLNSTGWEYAVQFSHYGVIAYYITFSFERHLRSA